MRSLWIACALAGAIVAGQVAAGARAADASRCDRQLVMQIDSATITPGADGFAIDAFGTSESAGWSGPLLVVKSASANGVANVEFTACRPEVSAQVLTPIQVRQTLKLDASATRQIVIRARTNTMTVEISKPQ
jgi:hypothetical protein